jgi:hypothetical protein
MRRDSFAVLEPVIGGQYYCRDVKQTRDLFTDHNCRVCELVMNAAEEQQESDVLSWNPMIDNREKGFP